LTKQFKENVAYGGNTTYDVDVKVIGSELDPNDIANAVITKLEKRESRLPSSRRNRKND
jgi:Ni,Fe-hydrogenase III small subunit